MERRSFLISAAASVAVNGIRMAAASVQGQESEADRAIQNHRTPDWFPDAKFGISAQWTPQSVPENGDWYARNMYVQGTQQYQDHLLRYGHPSRFGYKDLCPLWHGEEWRPRTLMDLYKNAGAKYFVALANHHDGFDCWNSRHQPWNSMCLGPKKDIVGGWREAAEACGLRFGAAFFCTQNWQWFQVSHGSDASGPMHGVPYDGRLTQQDGHGQWWESLDPQGLYGPPHPSSEPPSSAYLRNFEFRVRDLIAQHRPDLIFYTDNGLPLGELGKSLAAFQFQENAERHSGHDEAVICTKRVSGDLRHSIVCDRLPDDAMDPNPWQMDICIGDWHYKRGVIYKTAADIIPYLIDIVSKRGNLLLNIPIRANGSIDAEEIRVLEEMATWFAIYGEGIYGTRPWKVIGEGPTRTQNVDFPYLTVQYTEQDIRFTTKGHALYAFLLQWPLSRIAVIRTLGRNQGILRKEIDFVELPGSKSQITWRQDADALRAWLPVDAPSTYPCALRIHLRIA
jgi:alpha-L-fucosidase